MRQEFSSFLKDIVKSPLYWLPTLIITILAYGFTIFNRTISTDDLLWTTESINDQFLQTNRWGMAVWNNLIGSTIFCPFIDEYIALLFIIMSGIALSFLFYYLCKRKDIIGYTLLTCTLITYPLINEIWNYNGANYQYTGGLFLAIMSVIVFNSNWNNSRKILLVSLLLVLPASSYEAPIFTFITLSLFIWFYRYILINNERMALIDSYKLLPLYIIPLVFAVLIKYTFPLLYNTIMGTSYFSFGGTGTLWFDNDFFQTVKYCIYGNIYSYLLSSLVYLPITEFVLCLIFFCCYICYISIKRKTILPFLYGLVVMLSLFLLSFIQGYDLNYRVAQNIAVFVAIVVYLIYRESSHIKNGIGKWGVTIFLFFVCWHQSIFLNKIQTLNNLRSENEMIIVHHIGQRILSEFKNKPVVFVSSYSIGKWISEQTYVDSKKWNGKLFFYIYDKFSSNSCSSFKFIQTNVNPFLDKNLMITPKMIFDYYGYDIDIIESPIILREATKIAKEKGIRPFDIYDNGNYLIVQLSGVDYFVDYLEK